MKTVTATEYKHNALRLLEEVHRTGQAIRITKRGKAYAVLTPLGNGERPPLRFGQFEGTATIVGDLIQIIDPSDWSEWKW
ncbi:MAG: type II toxin-antitoxin system Phd/YefM family antitoxin [Fimbriimonadaceae bacterium]|nr:type II toxin-antitoxin system Phd/YefM family antitoxin [Fimbriimonadaceae bacterium]